MKTRQKRKSRFGGLIVPAIAALFLSYLALQAQGGRYGLDSKVDLAQTLERREADLAALTKQRERLEQRVSLISDGTLERDMIDERARRSLNYGTEDEIVILR